MSGAKIAADVAAGIREAGAATGDGAPLTGTILRRGAPNMTTTPPTPGVEEEYACTLVLGSFSARDRDGTNITMSDLKALIAPDAESDPRNGDKLRVGGVTYSIVQVEPVKPGGVVLMWKAQVRGA